jgi:DNA-binding NarL/FixJ family response regulator
VVNSVLSGSMHISSVSDNPHVKVLVADADAMTARLLASDLRRHNQFQVIDCKRELSCILDSIAKHAPAIVLFGTETREASYAGLPLLRRIRSQHPKTRAIVLADGSARELVAELFRAGIKGIFDRSDYDSERLCRCIHCVASGQVWATSEQLGFVLDVFAETASLRVVNTSGEELLTRREKDVVRLVAEGLGNRDIAQQLSLSIHTVKNYLFNIFDKLGISNRAELIMYVLSNNDHDLPLREDEVQPQPAKNPIRRDTYSSEQRMTAVAEHF